MNLETTYKKIIRKYTDNEKLINSLWLHIVTQYSGRYYHTLEHINNVIYELSHVNLNNYDATILAAFYHDVIYSVGDIKNNEYKSAMFAKFELMKFDFPYVDEVFDMILATDYSKKEYKYEYLKSEEKELNKDTKYLIDADYSGLGSYNSVYNENTDNIRKEYARYSDEKFNIGRIKFLQKLLNKDSLFLTEYFYNKYEDVAVYNISDELINRKFYDKK